MLDDEIDYLSNASKLMNKILIACDEEFRKIRTGRMTANVFDSILIDYYDTPTKLNQLAQISIPEAKLIIIEPYDKTVRKAIVDAISSSNLGFTPTDDGNLIRINVPDLTEERRKQYAKLARNKAEEFRVRIRGVRRQIKEEITSKDKEELPKDIADRYLKQLEEITKEFITKIDQMLGDKEKELLSF